MQEEVRSKVCVWCKEDKPLTEYHKKSKSTCATGTVSRCKTCVNPKTRPPFAGQVVQDGYKICSLCKVEKPLSNFHKTSKTTTGAVPRCKDCTNLGRSRLESRPGYRVCSKCKVEKPFSEFHKSNTGPLGHQSNCIQCRSEYNTRFKPKLKEGYKVCTSCKIEQPFSNFRRKSNKVKPLSRLGQKRTPHSELRPTCRMCLSKERKEYYKGSKDREAEYHYNRRLENPDKYKEWSKRYREENPIKVRAYGALRRANRIQATPKWANQELIKDWYRKSNYATIRTGILHHVDHVICLNHPLVCGLHTHTNMQILTGVANMGKSNKFSVDEDNTYYPPPKIEYTIKEIKQNGYKYKRT